jgi:hypothetical protein
MYHSLTPPQTPNWCYGKDEKAAHREHHLALDSHRMRYEPGLLER